MWAESRISATALQRLAHAAVLDGLVQVPLVALAKTGSWGLDASHCDRDCKRYLLRDLKLPGPSQNTIPCVDPKGAANNVVYEPVSILDPTLLIHTISHHYPEQYEILFATSKVRSFWDEHKLNDPKLYNHPMLTVPNWKSTFVPLWIHQDGVEFQDRNSLDVASFGSVLADGSALDTALYLVSWPHNCSHKHRGHADDTWGAIWRKLAFRFSQLYHGRFSEVDEFGDPWPDGSEEAARAGSWITPQQHRFVVFNLEGDRIHNSDEFGLPHHSKDTNQNTE